jgi:hypothetical protein
MKKLFVLFLMSVITSIALALPMPMPNQIENDLANGNYTAAKVNISEVLDDRPDSAQAHLLKSYVLIHEDKNTKDATEEMRTAIDLDKNGDVKSSPLFGKVVAEIQAAPATTDSGFVAMEPKQETSDESHWLPILLFVLIISMLIYFWRASVIKRDQEDNDTLLVQNPVTPQVTSYPSLYTSSYVAPSAPQPRTLREYYSEPKQCLTFQRKLMIYGKKKSEL